MKELDGRGLESIMVDCDYVYEFDNREACYDKSCASDMVDDLFQDSDPGDSIAIGRLREVSRVFAIRIPTKFHEGYPEEWETRFFNTEFDAGRAYATAIAAAKQDVQL